MRMPTVPSIPVVRPAAAQARLDEVRDGGLAARAGDADHAEVGGGVAVDVRGHGPEHRAGPGVDEQRGAPRSARRRRRAPSGSVRTATAPRARASAAKSAPCARAPGSAANRSPGRTSDARRVTPVTARRGVRSSAGGRRWRWTAASSSSGTGRTALRSRGAGRARPGRRPERDRRRTWRGGYRRRAADPDAHHRCRTGRVPYRDAELRTRTAGRALGDRGTVRAAGASAAGWGWP